MTFSRLCSSMPMSMIWYLPMRVLEDGHDLLVLDVEVDDFRFRIRGCLIVLLLRVALAVGFVAVGTAMFNGGERNLGDPGKLLDRRGLHKPDAQTSLALPDQGARRPS